MANYVCMLMPEPGHQIFILKCIQALHDYTVENLLR